MATDTLQPKYTVYDLGYEKCLAKTDSFYVNDAANSDKVVDSVVPALIGSGEMSGNLTMIDGYLQSSNYVSGSAGWRIDSILAQFYDIVLIGGVVRYGKTSFSDSVNAGYYQGPEGLYYGSATDATKLKYDIGAGTFEFIGNHSSGTIGGVTVGNVALAASATTNAVPVSLQINSQGIATATDGTQSAYVVLSWTANAESNFDHYIIKYKKHSYTYYTELTAVTNTITIDGLVPNTSYDFTAATVNKYGLRSDYCTLVTGTTTADTAAPATVTAGSATGAIQYVLIEWTHNTETDLASYNIYRSETNNSASGVLIANVRTNYFIDGNRVGGTTYYYWIKAVDTSGNVSAAFSTVKSAVPRNVTSDDIVTIAGSKVLIDGTVYLSNWRKTGDLTKIDGGSISANTITTTQLNFTPIQGSNVIASINASAEGIKIDADNLTINAATTFGAGYDPTSKVTTFAQDSIPTSVAAGDIWIDTNDDNKTYRAASAGADEIKAGEWILLETTKVKTFAQAAVPTSINSGDIWIDTDDNNKMYRAEIAGADQITAGEWVAVPDNNKLNALGGSYDTAASGARVRIFPDADTGIQAIDQDGYDVFKVMVGNGAGTQGDVIVGDYAHGCGLFFDKSGPALTAKVQYSNIKLYECVVDASGYGDYTTIGAAVTAGKKKIFVRCGSYTETATIAISGNTIIEGEERDGVIITFQPGANDKLFEITNNSIAQSNTVLIKNITFTSNATYANNCIYGVGRYSKIENCTFYGWKSIPVVFALGTFTVGGTTYDNGWDSVENCNFYDNYVSALQINGYYVLVQNNKFRNNYTTATTRLHTTLNIQGAYEVVKNNSFDNEVGGAILLAGYCNNISDNVIITCGAGINDAAGIATPYNTVGWTATLNIISKNIIRYAPIGIYLGTVSGNIAYQNIITENIIATCRRGGIKVEYANYFRILGNQLNGNTTDGDNTYSEILIDNSVYGTAANNHIIGNSGATNPQYGIRLTVGSDACIVTGNHVFNAQTTNISDAGSGNDVNHNVS